MSQPLGIFRNPAAFLAKLKKRPETYWLKRGEQHALKLFKTAARQVPAYRSFLQKNKIRLSAIKTMADFEKIPAIAKENYLKQYPLSRLCPQGRLKQQSWVISATSGSTGEPFYFPRTDEQDWQYAFLAELYLRDNFQIHRKTTLYVDAFPMGPWIGGLFTYQAIKYVAQRGQYPLSIITPGIDKPAVIQAIQKLGGHFDQVIIGAYGPFLKDIIDDGLEQGMDWKKYNLKFVFSAEAFSEGFRDYVLQRAGSGNLYKNTLNHYGTVDLGTMAHETPLSIMLRRLAVKNKKLQKAVFGQTLKLPTLAQYIPELFFFECAAGRLYCTASSGLPLVRYDLRDHGGLMSLAAMKKIFSGFGIDILQEAKRAGIADTLWQLPFVFVYERADFSISFYAFLIYPETIRAVLQGKNFEKALTGKFTMLTKFDKRQNQFVEINVELKTGARTSQRLKKLITAALVKKLIQDSSEYRATYKEKGPRVNPRLVFWPYEHPLYFKPGAKQKWVKKETHTRSRKF